MKADLFSSALQVLLMHFLLIVGLYRQWPLAERLALYPQLLAGFGRAEILRWVAPELLLTGTYLLGGLLLAWGLSSLFGRLPLGLLWLAESFTPYLILLLIVWAGLNFTLSRGLNFPLQPWQPLMLGFIVLSLALPAAARAALQTRQAQDAALRADFTRTARAMGLPEQRVRARAARVALPQRATGLAAETLGLGISLILIEGLLQFPGLGNEVYLALIAVMREVPPDTAMSVAWGDRLMPVQIMTVSALLLLGLSLSGAVALRGLAARLDPRPRVGEDA